MQGMRGKPCGAGDDEAEEAGSEDSSRREGKMPGKAEGGPRKRPIGTAWRDGSHMTIPMTTMYELNPATGQVGLSRASLMSWPVLRIAFLNTQQVLMFCQNGTMYTHVLPLESLCQSSACGCVSSRYIVLVCFYM